jgi:hypothetical protein
MDREAEHGAFLHERRSAAATIRLGRGLKGELSAEPGQFQAPSCTSSRKQTPRPTAQPSYQSLAAESSRLATSRTSSTTRRKSGASSGECLLGRHSACRAVLQSGDPPRDLAGPRFLGMNVWRTGETLGQAKGHTSALLFRETKGFFEDGLRSTHDPNATPGLSGSLRSAGGLLRSGKDRVRGELLRRIEQAGLQAPADNSAGPEFEPLTASKGFVYESQGQRPASGSRRHLSFSRHRPSRCCSSWGHRSDSS